MAKESIHLGNTRLSIPKTGPKELIRLENIKRIFYQVASQDDDENISAESKEKGLEILKGINMTINTGEFVALQGSSGSGKSTLLHILGLLDRPTVGSYFLEGEDVSKLSDDRLSIIRNQKLSFVFQSFYLIPYASALDNVLLPAQYNKKPLSAQKKRAEELLKQLGLGNRMHFKPSALSGGQQQRVAMARALLNDPEIIFADEPTGQLDSATSRDILNLFTEMNDMGRTIILVTHDSDTAASAKRIVLLQDGQIAGETLT